MFDIILDKLQMIMRLWICFAQSDPTHVSSSLFSGARDFWREGVTFYREGSLKPIPVNFNLSPPPSHGGVSSRLLSRLSIIVVKVKRS